MTTLTGSLSSFFLDENKVYSCYNSYSQDENVKMIIPGSSLHVSVQISSHAMKHVQQFCSLYASSLVQPVMPQSMAYAMPLSTSACLCHSDTNTSTPPSLPKPGMSTTTPSSGECAGRIPTSRPPHPKSSRCSSRCSQLSAATSGSSTLSSSPTAGSNSSPPRSAPKSTNDWKYRRSRARTPARTSAAASAREPRARPRARRQHGVAEEAPGQGVRPEPRAAVHRDVQRRARGGVGAAARRGDLPPEVGRHGLEGGVLALRAGLEVGDELAREVQQQVGDLGRVDAGGGRPPGGVVPGQELGAAVLELAPRRAARDDGARAVRHGRAVDDRRRAAGAGAGGVGPGVEEGGHGVAVGSLVVRGRGDDEAAAREAVDLEHQHVRRGAVDRRVKALEVPGRREREVVRERRGDRGLHDERARAALARQQERATVVWLAWVASGEEREARKRGGERVEERGVGGVGRGVGEEDGDVVGRRDEVEDGGRHLLRRLRRRRRYDERPLHLPVHGAFTQS
jgi:hypothetical protein